MVAPLLKEPYMICFIQDVVIHAFWRVVILVLKVQCTMIALFASRYNLINFKKFSGFFYRKAEYACMMQYLFESRNDVSILPCGHTIHMNCLKEMQEHSQ